MKPLIENEDCFTVDVFDYEEDRLVRWKSDTDFNHFQRNFKWSDHNIGFWYEDYNKALKFVRGLVKEGPLATEDTKQTLISTTRWSEDGILIKNLKKLQDEKQWDIIHFCVDQKLV